MQTSRQLHILTYLYSSYPSNSPLELAFADVKMALFQARKRYQQTSGNEHPTQTIFFLEMVRQRKRTNNQARLGDKDYESITGKITLGLVSPITANDLAEDRNNRIRAARRSSAGLQKRRSISMMATMDEDSSDVSASDGSDEEGEDSVGAFLKVLRILSSESKTRVPYRIATLTRLLRDALGGNCRTNVSTATCAIGHFHTPFARLWLLRARQ